MYGDVGYNEGMYSQVCAGVLFLGTRWDSTIVFSNPIDSPLAFIK
jgi:hypothetical protein